MLGDGHAERRKAGNGTRIAFFQEGSHVKYLLWLHNQFAKASLREASLGDAGYCTKDTPKISKRLGAGAKVRQIIRFAT